MGTTTARKPMLGFLHFSVLKTGTPAGFAALVWALESDGSNKVKLPAGARARRIAGIINYDNCVGKTAVAGDNVPLALTRESEVLIRAPGEGEGSVSVAQGDPLHIGNASGHLESYVLGTGTTELLGFSREKYTVSGSNPVPIVAQLHKQLIVQAMEVRGFTRAVLTNTTKYIGNDATELAADEVLFEAPWDGTLQGPFRVSVDASGGTPAGTITVTLRRKAPGGMWEDLPYESTTPWAVVLAASGSVTSADDTAASRPNGRSAAVVKGTKIGFKSVKDVSVANVAQLNARVAFI